VYVVALNTSEVPKTVYVTSDEDRVETEESGPESLRIEFRKAGTFQADRLSSCTVNFSNV
jgi:hypothetical protein